jgi:hypothetical protein
VDGYYDGFDRSAWARRYATAELGDPLRVLVVTSRYTTFLQHSSRDLAAAFERAGLRARVLIEEHDHAVTDRAVQMTVFGDYRPDLVVVLDHHRHEAPERYPGNVPFLCWIQDELAALFAPEVGGRLGELDFTMGYGRTRCVLGCGYPAERFMACRLAVDPGKFESAAGGGEDGSLRCDVVFVSNHAETPEGLRDRILSQNSDPMLRRLMEAFYEQTRELMWSPEFNAGYDLESLLREVEAKVELRCPDGPLRDRLMGVYVRPLADRTLRHATLGWVADWAEATGRVLHLYGRGWEEHPRFGRYACGVAEHGRQLGQIARQAGINLHTGSSPGLHQRVLETAAAGGFVMVRFHPLDFSPPGYESLRRLLVERGVEEPTRIPIDELPAEWVAGRRRRDGLMGRQTPAEIEITREYLFEQDPRRVADRRYDIAELAFTGFEKITFDGPRSFAERAEYYLSHPEERAEMARRMRAAVEELFTYDALAGRIISFIRGQLNKS